MTLTKTTTTVPVVVVERNMSQPKISVQLISAMQQIVNELWRICDRCGLQVVTTGEDLLVAPSHKTGVIAKAPRIERATGTSPIPAE